jgi:hypothetical protein
MLMDGRLSLKTWGLIALVAFIAFLLLSVNLQSKAKLSIVEGDSYDFGDVWPNQSLSHSFWITNKLSRAIHVTKVETSCSCTVVDFSSHVLKPFHGKMFQLELRTPNNEQQLNQQVVLAWQHENSSITNLLLFPIKAKVKNVADIDTIRWDFGRTNYESLPLTKTIKVSSARYGDIWDKVEAHAASKDLVTEVHGVGKGEFLIQVKLKESVLVGTFSDHVILNFVRGGKLLPVQSVISIEGLILNEFIVSPGALFITDVSPTVSKTIALKILRSNADPFRVVSAKSESPSTVKLSIPGKTEFTKEADLKCIISPLKGVKKLTGKINIAIESHAKKYNVSLSYLVYSADVLP